MILETKSPLETDRPSMPNELDPAAIAAGSVDEQIHPDFNASDQLDALTPTSELPDGVVSIADGRATRNPVETTVTRTSGDYQHDEIDTDPTPNGQKRKEVATLPDTTLGRLASLVMYGRLAGARAHYETADDARNRNVKQDLEERRQGVISRIQAPIDPIAQGEANKSAIQKDLDTFFSK